MASKLDTIDARVRQKARVKSDREVDEAFAKARGYCRSFVDFVEIPRDAWQVTFNSADNSIASVRVRIDSTMEAVKREAQAHIGAAVEEVAIQTFLARVEKLPEEESEGGTPD